METAAYKIKYIQWKRLMNDFSANVRSQNYAGNKGTDYIKYALEFIRWLETRSISSITRVKAVTLCEYMEYLQERPNRRRWGVLGAKTVKENLLAVRMLFDYAYAIGIIDYTVPFPKFILHDAAPKNILSTAEIKELFEACQNPRQTAVLTLAYGCGLRRNEMYRLNTADVATHLRTVYVLEGKGRKNRSIPLSDRAVSHLREYERNMRPQLLKHNLSSRPEPAYLLGNSGTRMPFGMIYTCIVNLALRTENRAIIAKKVTPHLLRHSIATHLLQNGAGLEWTAAFLGHSHLDSTQIYVKTRLARLRI